MLTLLTYPAGLGQFSLSPFCVKAAYFLTAAGVDWQREDLNDPRKMPMQKLPVLRTPQRLVADSEAIRHYLEANGATFDAGLSDLQVAQSGLMVRAAEEHLYFHLVMDRWLNDAIWPKIREIYFNEIPALLRRPVSNGLRNGLRRGLTTQGLARYSQSERFARADADLTAIATILGDQAFLFGATPTAADFSIGAILGAMRVSPGQTQLSDRVAQDSSLAPYLDRLDTALPLAPATRAAA